MSPGLAIIGSDNGLSLGRRQAIIWTSAVLLSTGTLEINSSQILFDIQFFSFKKIHLKMSSGKCRQFCVGLNVLTSTICVTFVSLRLKLYSSIWDISEHSSIGFNSYICKRVFFFSFWWHHLYHYISVPTYLCNYALCVYSRTSHTDMHCKQHYLYTQVLNERLFEVVLTYV